MLVKIKTFNGLKIKYGIDSDGDVKIPDLRTPYLTKGYFTKELESIIPKDRVIDVISQGRFYIWSPNKNEDEEYLIVDEMIEKILNPEEDPEYFI